MDHYRNPIEDINRFFRSESLLARLILINTGLWIIIGIARVFGFLFNLEDNAVTSWVAEYVALPANLDKLISKPWTLITYMFIHVDFFHILFNMLWLYWFGKIFLEFLKERQLMFLYLLGGLAGGILFILFYNVFPVFKESVWQSVALGASASVMAIVTAIAFYVPGYAVYLFLLGKIRIFYIAIALFVLDFFMIRSENAGGHIAHIGGALFGMFYILTLRKGMNFSDITGSWRMKGFLKRWMRKPRPKFTVYENDYKSRPLSDEEYNLRKAEKQKKIDLILDKIAKSGYESLSREEKEILFKSGNSG